MSAFTAAVKTRPVNWAPRALRSASVLEAGRGAQEPSSQGGRLASWSSLAKVGVPGSLLYGSDVPVSAFPAVTRALAHTHPAAQEYSWRPALSFSNTFPVSSAAASDEVSVL